MIIGFIGRMGSGKSLSMVKYAHMYYKAGYRILSNIKLNFPYENYKLQDLIDFANSGVGLKKVVILLDEAHIFLDSRSSVSKRNRIISYFLLQTRKKGCHLYYTTQRFGQVDKRLRENTDVTIQCSSKKTKENISYTLNEVNILTDSGIRTERLIYRSDKYYNLYDTYEVVQEV